MPEYDTSIEYLTVAQAALALSVHPQTVRIAVAEDRLPAVNMYGRILIAPDDLETYRLRTRGPEGEKPRGRPRKAE